MKITNSEKLTDRKLTNKECMACFRKSGTRVRMYAVDITTKNYLSEIPVLGEITPHPTADDKYNMILVCPLCGKEETVDVRRIRIMSE